MLSDGIVPTEMKWNEWLGVNRLTEAKKAVTPERIGTGQCKRKRKAAAGTLKAIVPLVPDRMSVRGSGKPRTDFRVYLLISSANV